ncbi:MAG: phosphatidate cytidylyltransferase [Alphaproteobacteria bacterium]|nr:phosphatidate cytidylyltransferase [Alphaproteobacteria bacterium]MCB9975768.1 phosphatidate cytidylyltransferase [Rhodospirillales bacterium]
MLSVLFANPVYLSIAGVFGVLIVASVIVRIMRRNDTEGHYRELDARVKSWWFMIVIFSLAIVTSPVVSVIFFAFLSFLALKEYFSIIPLRKADRRALFWAYLAIPVQYYFVANGLYGLFIVFIPVWVFFLLPFRLIVAGQTDGFLNSVAKISWGLMIAVFAVSHAAMLMQYSKALQGHVGLIMFLAVLNQGNDVAQYVWGKLFGKTKIVPEVSPKKTWEGFMGGVMTTVVIAGLIYPLLTPFTFQFALLTGVLIAVTGFIGDVTFSALKRDLKIKDSGNLIPGHGGILDRIDSLSLTAPLFFHCVRYFYFVG